MVDQVEHNRDTRSAVFSDSKLAPLTGSSTAERLVGIFSCLVVLVAPLGIALQNITAGLLVIGAIAASLSLYRSGPTSYQEQLPLLSCPLIRAVLTLPIVYVLWSGISTALAPSGDLANYLEWTAGYLFWCLGPVLTYYLSSYCPKDYRRKVYHCFIAIAIFAGLIALSQYVIGWRIAGSQIVSAPFRARGLYSHPLTFAYGVALLWPWALAGVIGAPRRGLQWLIFLGVVAALFTSESRTIQACALGSGLILIVRLLKGRSRKVAISLFLAAIAIVAISENPVSKRFAATLAGNFDNQSGYLDDRLAFWHAHLEIFKQRPLTGTGVTSDREHLSAAYRTIGLQDFSKQYAAHNQYIQVVCDRGLIGLGVFLIWLMSCLKLAYQKEGKLGFLTLTWLLFIVATITQNGFQDSEVRYSLTLLTCLTVYAQPKQSLGSSSTVVD